MRECRKQSVRQLDGRRIEILHAATFFAPFVLAREIGTLHMALRKQQRSVIHIGASEPEQIRIEQIHDPSRAGLWNANYYATSIKQINEVCNKQTNKTFLKRCNAVQSLLYRSAMETFPTVTISRSYESFAKILLKNNKQNNNIIARMRSGFQKKSLSTFALSENESRA